MKRIAFTMTELIIGITILGIMATAIAINPGVFAKQTAKKEAERAAAYIQAQLRMADITKDALWFDIESDKIELKKGKTYASSTLQKPTFKASGGCSYSYPSYPSPERLCYHVNTKSSTYDIISNDAYVTTSADPKTSYCITVNDADGKQYNVLIER